MRNIVKRPYRNLADFMNVYHFMIDNYTIDAFCFYESQIGSAFFSLKDEYDKIIPEMISHAEQRLSNDDGSL